MVVIPPKGQDWGEIIIRNGGGVKENKENTPHYERTQSTKIEESEGKTNMVSASLAKQVINARTAKKMNRKQLAQAINVHESYIARFETCKESINHQILQKMRKVLGVKLVI